MRRIALLIPALALLPACGKADGELNPGSWKTTMTMTKFDIPGAPAAMLKAAQSALGKGESSDSCMSSAQARAGVRDFSGTMQQGQCKMEDFKQSGGKMSGKMVCTDSAMGATAMKMDGSYTPEMVNMTLSGEITEKSLPGGKATIEMTINSARTGECKS